MLINGIELSEPEIRAKLKAMAEEIVRLNEVIKRYESENQKLTEKLDDIGEQYNAQVTVIGFLEEDNKRLDDKNKELKRLLKAAVEFRKSGYCTKNCSECVASPCDYIDWFKNMYDNEIKKLIGEEGE